jgi:hypothetical protein
VYSAGTVSSHQRFGIVTCSIGAPDSRLERVSAQLPSGRVLLRCPAGILLDPERDDAADEIGGQRLAERELHRAFGALEAGELLLNAATPRAPG